MTDVKLYLVLAGCWLVAAGCCCRFGCLLLLATGCNWLLLVDWWAGWLLLFDGWLMKHCA
jgi:hypothetical protein